ncbi:MAG: CHAD domain-containing protein [Candidatus Acidiferrales bacterium]
MNRANDRAEKAQHGFDIDDVHDLRVALRRCRTMADAMSEVNPSSGWRKLKKTTGAMFRSLGELRDVQVISALAKELGPARDPIRQHMLGVLAAREKECRKAAAEALDSFDRKEWKKLARKLGPKARFFPLGSVVFQRLALARLNQAAELYQQARRKHSSAAWHRVRIAIKRFRYVLNNFLPRRYETWSDDLKHVQDLLGEIHDLEVLRAAIRHDAALLNSSSVAAWNGKIDAERKSRLAEVNSKLHGPQSLWLTWRAGFPLGHSLTAVPTPERQRRTA